MSSKFVINFVKGERANLNNQSNNKRVPSSHFPDEAHSQHIYEDIVDLEAPPELAPSGVYYTKVSTNDCLSRKLRLECILFFGILLYLKLVMQRIVHDSRCNL